MLTFVLTNICQKLQINGRTSEKNIINHICKNLSCYRSGNHSLDKNKIVCESNSHSHRQRKYSFSQTNNSYILGLYSTQEGKAISGWSTVLLYNTKSFHLFYLWSFSKTCRRGRKMSRSVKRVQWNKKRNAVNISMSSIFWLKREKNRRVCRNKPNYANKLRVVWKKNISLNQKCSDKYKKK